jgi:hypothetical protein
VQPNINSVEFHPQPSNNGHPVDGALVSVDSLTAAVTYNYILGLSEPTATSAPSNWKHVRTQFWMNPNLRVKDVRVHKHMGGSKQTTGSFH